MNKTQILASRKPVKKKTHIHLKERIRYIYNCCMVRLGFRVWAKPVYSRPKYQICPFHGCYMKRGRRTAAGAYYYCHKCKRVFHLEGGGMKLVPIGGRNE